MYIVDRIENNFVVLEDRTNNLFLDINLDLFNYDVKEGDIVYFDGTNYIKDENITNEIKKEVRSKFDMLKE